MIEDLEYLQPSSIQEAIALLAQYGDEAKAMAGGQTLIPMLWQRLLTPQYLVSLRGIKGLETIERDGQGNLLIGACATHRQVEASPLVQEGWPVLAETIRNVAAPQIRNLGTLAGDLCHSDYGADPPATLLALDARVRIVGPGQDRWVPMDEFFVDLYTTALGADDLLAQIQVPPMPPGARAAYVKYCLRAMDPAIVGVAAVLVVEDGLCQETSIGINGAATVPIRASAAEEALKGRPLDQASLNEAAALAQEQARPMSDSHASAEYRKKMVGVFVKRALRAAFERVPA
jgi:carbon-monoxide dehydrogenase medium subunit